MQTLGSARPLLAGVLSASMLSTAVHYAHNYVFMAHYPQPAWITAPIIPLSWLLMTVIGLFGYWLYCKGKFWLAYGCLLVYSVTGLSSLGHYFYGSMAVFSPEMHIFIMTDGLTGLALVGFVFWSWLIRKEPYRTSSSQRVA